MSDADGTPQQQAALETSHRAVLAASAGLAVTACVGATRDACAQAADRAAPSEPKAGVDGVVEFRAAHTRWILEPAAAGEGPRIDRFAVNVARFDLAVVTRGLEALGARIWGLA